MLMPLIQRPGEIVEVDRSSFTQLQCVKQWLYRFLPRSSATYCTVCRIMEPGFESAAYRIFVDALPQPSALAIVQVASPVQASIYPWGESAAGVASLCAVAAQGYVRLTVGATEEDLEQELKKNLSRAGFHLKYTNPCSLFVFEGARMPSEDPAAGLDSCYTITPLELSDAPLVNDTWKYKDEHSMRLMQKIISTMPCFGVRYSNGDSSELVAWCLTYPNGAIGTPTTQSP